MVRTQTTGSPTYLLIVDNEQVDGKVKQRVLHYVARFCTPRSRTGRHLYVLSINTQCEAREKVIAYFMQREIPSIRTATALFFPIVILDVFD